MSHKDAETQEAVDNTLASNDVDQAELNDPAGTKARLANDIKGEIKT